MLGLSPVQIFWAILIAIALLSLLKMMGSNENPFKGFIRIENVEDDEEGKSKKYVTSQFLITMKKRTKQLA